MVGRSCDYRTNTLPIGHGALEFGEFLEILATHNIRTVIDVRSKPYSSHQPEYAKQALSEELTTAGISYRWLGNHLGGLPIREGDAPPIANQNTLDAGVTEASALAGGATSVCCAQRLSRPGATATQCWLHSSQAPDLL